jgi:hypothetical protein
MAKTENVILALLITFAIVAASGCSGTSNTTTNVTPVSEQAPNLTNISTPEYNVQVYPANKTEINESIEEAENITSPRIVNATYVKPPQPAEREASEQSYTPINFNNSYVNTPVPSGSQPAYSLKIITANNSSTLTINITTLVGNPQRDLIIAQNRTSSNGTIIVEHNY